MSTSRSANVELAGLGGKSAGPLPVVPPGAEAVQSGLADARPSVIFRLFSALESSYRGFLHRQKVRRFKRSLEDNPESVSTLNVYANYLESCGMLQEAAGIHGRMVTICRRQKEADQAAVYCRKVDAAGSPDAERCYRELATLYSELNRFDEAARAAKRVVELYLAESQHKAAAGYIRQLPPLGSRLETVRTELLGMLNDVSIQREPHSRPISTGLEKTSPNSGSLPPPSAYSTRPLTDAAESAADDVFLSGHMGRITPFDVVQIVESNSLTGRLDFQADPTPGAIFFRDGRIVAAIYGGKRGYLALRAVFTGTPGPFRVVVTDEVPDDEFAARSNTGLVLDVLREIDEATDNVAPELVRPGQDDFYL